MVVAVAEARILAGRREAKEPAMKTPETASNREQLSAVMSREIKKMEETLYSHIGRLVGKELHKQRECPLFLPPRQSRCLHFHW
jgi:hypothetical protein